MTSQQLFALYDVESKLAELGVTVPAPPHADLVGQHIEELKDFLLQTLSRIPRNPSIAKRIWEGLIPIYVEESVPWPENGLNHLKPFLEESPVQGEKIRYKLTTEAENLFKSRISLLNERS